VFWAQLGVLVKLKFLWPVLILVLFLVALEDGYWIRRFRKQVSRPVPAVKKLEEAISPPVPNPDITPEEIAQLRLIGPLANWMKEEEARQQVATPRPYQPHKQDRILPFASPAPKSILHKTFLVREYATFEIYIPAGIVEACLSGSYESFTRLGEKREPAEVQVSLLDEKEVHDFLKGKPGAATYATNPSSEHSIKWALNTNYKQPKKYYLVFSNPGAGFRTRWVKADFTTRFD
jgi:hypothetical protein